MASRRRLRRRWPGVSAPGSALAGPPGAHAGPLTEGTLITETQQLQASKQAQIPLPRS
jgi:hypothetical protein